MGLRGNQTCSALIEAEVLSVILRRGSDRIATEHTARTMPAVPVAPVAAPSFATTKPPAAAPAIAPRLQKA